MLTIKNYKVIIPFNKDIKSLNHKKYIYSLLAGSSNNNERLSRNQENNKTNSKKLYVLKPLEKTYLLFLLSSH